jgi:hypothetical protein
MTTTATTTTTTTSTATTNPAVEVLSVGACKLHAPTFPRDHEELPMTRRILLAHSLSANIFAAPAE